jgi:hypothetical protein
MRVFKFRLPRIWKPEAGPGPAHHEIEKPKPRHLDPPKSAPRLVSELNSSELRALEKEARGHSIEEIRDLLIEHKPSRVADFDRIVASGRRRPFDALRSMRLKEAADVLGSLHELERLAAVRKAGALLPVPPHIGDHVLYSFDEDLVLATEDHLPHHLARMGYDRIDDLLPDDIAARFRGIEAMLLEGFVRRGSLMVRKAAAAAIQIVGNEDLRLFVHPMPHLPDHIAFEEVGRDYPVIELP